jgi:hypothetical protein
MNYETWLKLLKDEDIEVRRHRQLWNRICFAIKRNARNQTEAIGFDVIHLLGDYKIVDSSTQVPVTNWHPNYEAVLKELQSCVL